jgi:protoporphyrinogen oxidase
MGQNNCVLATFKDCIINIDQAHLIYYGGEVSKIPPSSIHLNKSEAKLKITKEKKLQEILNCNAQIFLPQEKQINTDKCYRGWYNEIIEN